jgi:hypothetical protein
MHDVLRYTVLNTVFTSGSDPTIMIRDGYNIDSKRANDRCIKTPPANAVWGYISLRPEGPRQNR